VKEGGELDGYIVDGLVEFGLARVPGGHPLHERFDIHHWLFGPLAG
jgi:hypothetical protein